MKKLYFFIVLLFCNNIYSEQPELVSIYKALQTDKTITYIPVHNKTYFLYPEFPLAQHPQWHPYEGIFAETFIVKIPNGKVSSIIGFVHHNNQIFSDFLPQNYSLERYYNYIEQCNIKQSSPTKIPGKVLVLTRIDTDCYGHWIGEILGRLAIIQQYNIEYDWIYTPYDKPYIKETLELLGVDSSKIITPYLDYFHIQADELLVPSLTVRRVSDNYTPHYCTMYCPKWVITWLRDRFIPQALSKYSQQSYCNKIFISREDSYQRKMLNEDEVFSLFEKKGFKKYTLAEMSFLEQVMLFSQATCIVSAHGSGLTNLIFCNPNAKVIELYQNQFDTTFWQISQTIGLEHHCIKTQEYIPTSWKINTVIPINIIKECIEKLL